MLDYFAPQTFLFYFSVINKVGVRDFVIPFCLWAPP